MLMMCNSQTIGRADQNHTLKEGNKKRKVERHPTKSYFLMINLILKKSIIGYDEYPKGRGEESFLLHELG